MKKWIIFKELGRYEVPYVLCFKDEYVNETEIAYCIEEQIYKK